MSDPQYSYFPHPEQFFIENASLVDPVLQNSQGQLFAWHCEYSDGSQVHNQSEFAQLFLTSQVSQMTSTRPQKTQHIERQQIQSRSLTQFDENVTVPQQRQQLNIIAPQQQSHYSSYIGDAELSREVHQSENQEIKIQENQKLETIKKELVISATIQKKRFYQQDELIKSIMRKLVKFQRQSFLAFTIEQCGRDIGEQSNIRMLYLYLKQNFNLDLKKQDLWQAKSLFYGISAKMLETELGDTGFDRVRKLRNPFIEKGTQKQARRFFKHEVNFRVFFKEFTILLDFIAEKELFTDKKSLFIKFTKLFPLLLQQPQFYKLLDQSIEMGQTFPNIVMDAFLVFQN